MKTLRTLFFIISVGLLSCNTISQLASFVNCKYEFAGLGNPTIAGVDLSNVSSVDKLSPTALLKLSTAYLSGELPLSTTVKVQATNPNATEAQIEGLDWEINLDDKNLLAGNLNQKVAVAPNGGQTIIPIAVNVNLMELLKGESKDNILNLVNNMLNAGEGSSRISVRVKPLVMVGGQKISTGFINLSHTVK